VRDDLHDLPDIQGALLDHFRGLLRRDLRWNFFGLRRRRERLHRDHWFSHLILNQPHQLANSLCGSASLRPMWPCNGRPSSANHRGCPAPCAARIHPHNATVPSSSTASSRMTTAFSRLPPRISPFLIRNSISSKKQNVRACEISCFHVSGDNSTVKNCENRPALSELVHEIFSRSLRKNRHQRVLGLQFQRCRHAVRLSLLTLWHVPAAIQHPAIFARAAVANWRLVRIQLNDGIVDLETRKCRQHVLDCLDLRVPLRQGCERFVWLTFSMRASISGLPPNRRDESECRCSAARANSVIVTRLPL